jgi:CheY-like chemotaxis protein
LIRMCESTWGSAYEPVSRVSPVERWKGIRFPFRAVSTQEKHAMRRVLVIDDDISIRIAIELSLRRQDCVAVLADNGPLGVSAFESSEFDMAMVDIFMPEMDGLEIIKSFRERAPTLPIVAMSGYRLHHALSGSPDFLEMAIKLGATYPLRKPFGPGQLKAALDACLPERLTRTG